MRPILRLALLSVALALAACAALTLRDPPQVDIVAVQLDRVAGPDAYFSIGVVLTSTGADDLVIDSLQGKLSIEGEEIAQASLVGAPVHLPAHGTANAELQAHAGMDAVLRAIAAAMKRGAMVVAPGERPTLRYTLDGSATFAGGARMPFRRSGELGERRPS